MVSPVFLYNTVYIYSPILQGMFLIGKRNLRKSHLVLDGSIDLIEGGHSRKLLRDLLIVGPLLWVLTKLNEEKIRSFFSQNDPRPGPCST